MDRSPHLKCGIDRLKQRRITEWLKQALHGALFEQARADRVIPVGGDENDRNVLSTKRQFPLEIGSGHARHGDVKDQASGLADAIRRQKVFSRGECLDREAELPQQVW